MTWARISLLVLCVVVAVSASPGKLTPLYVKIYLIYINFHHQIKLLLIPVSLCVIKLYLRNDFFKIVNLLKIFIKALGSFFCDKSEIAIMQQLKIN